MMEGDAAVQALLQETVRRYVDPAARIEAVRELPITAGESGETVQRYEATLSAGLGAPAVARLVVKQAGLVERRTLAHLNAQGQPNVPFSYTPDLTADGPGPLC